MIGLAGAQRVGKTTLASHVSQKYGIPLVKTNTTAVFEKMGVDPRDSFSLTDRLGIQHAILDSAEEIYSNSLSLSITDRTPVDMYAYTLADITQADGYLEFDELMNYKQRCVEVTREHFSHVYCIQPGIELVEERGKAAANPAHMEKINTIIVGLLFCDEILEREGEFSAMMLKRSILDLDERADSLWDSFVETKTELVEPSVNYFGSA